MKNTVFLALFMLPLMAHADRKTFTVEPATTREDGTLIKRSDYAKCRLLDVTDPAKAKSLSSSLLSGPYTHREDVPGVHRYAADCTDSDGNTSARSTVVTWNVVGETAGSKNPKQPALTAAEPK